MDFAHHTQARSTPLSSLASSGLTRSEDATSLGKLINSLIP
jgi:hypothetical protein